jgi:hypothetical protein
MLPVLFSIFVTGLIILSRYQNGEATLPFVGYLCLLIGALLAKHQRDQQREEFLLQLKSQRSELRRGGTVVVNGMLLRYQTVLATYRIHIGGLLCDVSIPSPFRSVVKGDRTEAFLSSICTMMGGWWSFPHGPAITLAAILLNLTGGERKSVAELIDEPIYREKPPKDEEKPGVVFRPPHG